MKKCTKCGEEKSLDAFYKSKRGKSGYDSRCKTCEIARKKCTYVKRKANPPLLVIPKECSRCGKKNPASEFYTSMATVLGLSSRCKVCISEISKDTYVLDKTRKSHLRRKYGLTVENYTILLKEQDGKCAICDSKDAGRQGVKNLAVDHNHSTGKVRGLLCSRCNLGIGHLDDDPNRLEAAAAYLRKHNNAL